MRKALNHEEEIQIEASYIRGAKTWELARKWNITEAQVKQIVFQTFQSNPRYVA